MGGRDSLLQWWVLNMHSEGGGAQSWRIKAGTHHGGTTSVLKYILGKIVSNLQTVLNQNKTRSLMKESANDT